MFATNEHGPTKATMKTKQLGARNHDKQSQKKHAKQSHPPKKQSHTMYIFFIANNI